MSDEKHTGTLNLTKSHWALLLLLVRQGLSTIPPFLWEEMEKITEEIEVHLEQSDEYETLKKRVYELNKKDQNEEET